VSRKATLCKRINGSGAASTLERGNVDDPARRTFQLDHGLMDIREFLCPYGLVEQKSLVFEAEHKLGAWPAGSWHSRRLLWK